MKGKRMLVSGCCLCFCWVVVVQISERLDGRKCLQSKRLLLPNIPHCIGKSLRHPHSSESLDGYADVWIKTPKRQNRVFCNILINRGGEARMIVSAGILGWPVADLFFSRDSLYVHDMLNNRLFQGSNNELNLEKILGVNSGYRLLSESLLGLVKITEPSSAIRTVKKGSGKLLVHACDPNGNAKRWLLILPTGRLVRFF